MRLLSGTARAATRTSSPNDINTDALVYARTTDPVLAILYGAPGAHSGLFYPDGLNGAIS